MKATQPCRVMALAAKRHKLQEMANAAKVGLINLSVAASIAGASINASVRPAIIAEYRAQIAAVDPDLKALGAEVD